MARPGTHRDQPLFMCGAILAAPLSPGGPRSRLPALSPKGSSSTGRAPVSKTGGCRFDSCLPCHRVGNPRSMTRSQPAAAKIFLTGDPGCGKTTAMRRVVERLGLLPMTGFYTEEVRENGTRTGFRGVTLDGKVFTLARAGAAGDFRVGPYGISLEALEAVGVPALR